jgi:general secretion pathway protein A
MYAKFFGLKREPFSIAPDPRYLFMSERHREALAHLLYGLGGGGGFVLLTGEIGAGKTTVCRCFLEQIPKNCNVAYIFNPKLTVTELLKSVCDEFHIELPQREPGTSTVKDYLDPLNQFLLRTHAIGQNNVLIIDEAQSLSIDVLEQLRLLTNLETNERKLLQIILIGQPELRTMLARPELEQLAQRVIARFHLEALSEVETRRYIRHRLAIGGLSGAGPFDREARVRIHELSRGIPRRINMLCDRALLGAYASGRQRVDRATIDRAAAEVFDKAGSADPQRTRRALAWGLAALAGAAVLGAGLFALDGGLARLLPGHMAAQSKAASAAAASPASGASAAVLAGRAASAASGVAAGPVRAANATAAATAAPMPARAASGLEFLAAAELQARFKTQHRNERDAWRELAPAWKLELDASDPCREALKLQVHCYRSSSTLALIRQLGRPGIVTLYDDDNRPIFALLTGLSGRAATLRMGGTVQTVSLVSLAGMWRGEFATLWRAPPGYAPRAVETPPRALAEWLTTQLGGLTGAAPAPGGAAGGAALKSRVIAFQLAQGLKPDGLVGPTTLMQLNRAIGIDEPRLDTEG